MSIAYYADQDAVYMGKGEQRRASFTTKLPAAMAAKELQAVIRFVAETADETEARFTGEQDDF